ncbi:MAG TPA: cellulase family glycosylhydrolase [Candidatus Dormibacteraeota bacterium]
MRLRVRLVILSVIAVASASIPAVALAASPRFAARIAQPRLAPRVVAPLSLTVSGNQLMSGSGATVSLHGVNRSGTEYGCVQNFGPFDGPSDAASVQAIASWHVNIVRVLLNEDCWLGINGAPNGGYSAATYRQDIVNYVNLLHQYGMYAEVSLIWAAPGTNLATDQPGAPDADHSPSMWAGMATAFKNDPAVILAPWGETIVDASCFLNGGVCEATYGPSNAPYNTAGMQQAVTTMRNAGYNGVIAIPCLTYANDCTQWLAYEPADPQHKLVAEAHIYGKNTCSTVSCFNAQLLPVAQTVPMIWGEAGESWDGSDCGSSVAAVNFPWAMAHTSGIEAWTWDTWTSCDALIASYSGSASTGYGQWVQAYYASLRCLGWHCVPIVGQTLSNPAVPWYRR